MAIASKHALRELACWCRHPMLGNPPHRLDEKIHILAPAQPKTAGSRIRNRHCSHRGSHRMRAVMERRASPIGPSLGRVPAVASGQTAMSLVVVELKSQAGGVIECRSETSIASSFDHGPVLLMTIRVTHDGVQDEVANEDVPSVEMALKAGRRPDSIERSVYRFDGVPLAVSLNHRIWQKFVTVNELLLAVRFPRSGGDEEVLADHSIGQSPHRVSPGQARCRPREGQGSRLPRWRCAPTNRPPSGIASRRSDG